MGILRIEGVAMFFAFTCSCQPMIFDFADECARIEGA